MATLTHPVFGRLEEDNYGTWNGQALWQNGRPLELSFDFHPVENADLAQRAAATLQHVTAHELVYRKQLCHSMVELGKDWYEPEDDDAPKKLNLEDFIAWTSLGAISFASDGAFNLWYDDAGKVFAGHAIVAEYDPERNLLETNIQG